MILHTTASVRLRRSLLAHCMHTLVWGACLSRTAAAEPTRSGAQGSVEVGGEPRSRELAPAGDPIARDGSSHGSSRGRGEPLVWQPGWRRFGWIDATLVGVGAGAAGLALIVGPDRESPRAWKNAFDEQVRAWILPESRSTRQFVRHLSDVTLGLNLAYAYVGDAWLNAAWYRASPDVGWQLALIDSQVLALTTGFQLWTANLASRERPYGRECGATIDAGSSDCTSDYRYRSFFSGHTSFSFALASATCTHHAHLPLTPGRGGWVPCAGTLTLAALTGVARMVGDQHYATDVLVGAFAGSAIGWFVPFLYYAGGSGRPTQDTSVLGTNPLPLRWTAAPLPLPGGAGFAISGAW